MKLDGIIDKDTYIKKEQEIKSQITDIEEKIVEAPTSLKEFDKETFDSIVERIIIGEDGNDEQVVRFILKIGNVKKITELIQMCHLVATRDLAKLYRTETKRINEAVRRNIGKFPERFC